MPFNLLACSTLRWFRCRSLLTPTLRVTPQAWPILSLADTAEDSKADPRGKYDSKTYKLSAYLIVLHSPPHRHHYSGLHPRSPSFAVPAKTALSLSRGTVFDGGSYHVADNWGDRLTSWGYKDESSSSTSYLHIRHAGLLDSQLIVDSPHRQGFRKPQH